MPSFTDQLGRIIILDHPPSRIISLVPSQTELLHTLNAPVVGITKFCTHPNTWFREKPRVGGTKNIHPHLISALQPDLIIANKEENDRAQIEQLAAQYPVWVSDIHNLSDALAMIRSIGELTGQPQPAQTLALDIQKKFDTLPSAITPLRTAYLIWRTTAPLSYMASGNDTFIHDMLLRCGLTNHFATQPRYPTINPNDLANCDLILLSSEPYPFTDIHVRELQTINPRATIRLVDGELFSWYGSRLLKAPAYFRHLLKKDEL
jgi:ABC-type Fe3+-hydroxamate transport system substrate-binding protein